MKSYFKQRQDFFWQKSIADVEYSKVISKKSLVTLSDSELLWILLKNNRPKSEKIKKAIQKILRELNSHGFKAEPKFFINIEGMDEQMANRLAAAFEFVRRQLHPYHRKIETAEEVFYAIQHYAHLPQEHFIAISLNGANEILEIRVVTIGLVNRTQVHPREVFADVLTDRATAVILAHNHPSGQLEPSQEDIEITQRLIKAGNLLGIQILDHLIICSRGYYSFLEEGML